MKEMFPIWYRILALFVIGIYVVLVVLITEGSWDALTGVDTSQFAVWRYIWWMFGVVGGAIYAIAVLVFSHAMGVWQPLMRKQLWDNFPPPPQ